MRSRVFVAVVAGVAFVAAFAGAALAAPASSSKQRHLPAGSTHVAPGPRGVRPQGALRNYIVESAVFDAPSGAQTAGVVECPRHTVDLGGGISIPSSSLLANVADSNPLAGLGWHATANNASGSDTSFIVLALCAKAPKGYSILTDSADNPPGTQTPVRVTCPTGTKALGGGGGTTDGNTATNLNTSSPYRHHGATGWDVNVNNNSTADNTAWAYVECGKVKGWSLQSSTAVDNPAETQSLARVSCPGDTVPTGGGVFSGSTNLLTNINSTCPESGMSGWSAWENNASTNDQHMDAWAVCADL